MKYTKLIFIIFISLVFVGCDKEESYTKLSSDKELLTFSFRKLENPQLLEDYSGTISAGKVAVNIPNGVDINQLVATFRVSEKAIIKIGNTIQISGQTQNNFNSQVTYTIVAEDESTSNYNVEFNRLGNSQNYEINNTTSYFQYQSNVIYTNFQTAIGNGIDYLAKAYADFDKDGDLDIMAMYFNYVENVGLEVEYFQNNGSSFVGNQSVFNGLIPKYVHGRKAIIGDFDKNGWTDVVIAGHGWDKPPFPGEELYIMLNTNGKFSSNKLPLPAGFYHSVCSGDIDNDGDLDLFFTNNFNVGKFLINNGNGTFTYDASVFPSSLANKNYYTSELYDINNDGYLDLVNTGHEMEGANSIVLWGNYTGKYAIDRMTTLPQVNGNGIAIDIDFIDYNNDNKTDILLTRTGDNTGLLVFYQGYYLQMIKNEGVGLFTDVTSTVINSNANPNAQWIDWIRIHDINNDSKMDITTDNKSYNLEWLNVNGVFSR